MTETNRTAKFGVQASSNSLFRTPERAPRSHSGRDMKTNLYLGFRIQTRWYFGKSINMPSHHFGRVLPATIRLAGSFGTRLAVSKANRVTLTLSQQFGG